MFTIVNLDSYLKSVRTNHCISKHLTGLYCVHYGRNDECVTGGLSLIVDGLAVVEKLRVTHPHHFDTLVRVPTTFQRIYDSEYATSQLICRLEKNNETCISIWQGSSCAYGVQNTTHTSEWTWTGLLTIQN